MIGCPLAGRGAAALSKVQVRTIATSPPTADICSKVDVFIGSGPHGHTFPGATLAFRIAQLSPDTDKARWDTCSGYHHDDRPGWDFASATLDVSGGRVPW